MVKKRDDETTLNEPLRHKTQGHGTHGEPTRKDIDADDRRDAELPEGNGATGAPAAFPDRP